MVKRIKTTIKVFLIVLVAMPVIVLGGFVGAIAFIDFNQYKTLIEEEVQAKTGREFRIEGDVEVSSIPFRLTLGASRLEQSAPFAQAEQPFLTFESISLRLSLRHLLTTGQLNLREIEWTEPKLNLQRNAQGDTNWQDLWPTSNQPNALSFYDSPQEDVYAWRTVAASAQADAGQVVPAQAMQVSESEGSSLWSSLQLKGFAIYDGHVNWQDELLQHQFSLTDFQLMSFDLAFDQPFAMQMQGLITDQNRAATYRFNMPARLQLADDLSAVSLLDARLNWLVSESEQADYQVDMGVERFDWHRDRMTLQQASIAVLGSALQLDMQAEWQDEWQLESSVKITEANPRRWARHWSLPWPDFVEDQVFSRVQGELDFAANPEGWQLNNMDLTLDDTRLLGQFSRQHHSGTAYHLDLNLGELSLDRYQIYAPGREQVYHPLALPVSTLREALIQGQINIEALTLWQTRYEDVVIGVNNEDGLLQLAPLDAQLYQGRLRSELTIQVKDEVPQYHAKGRLVEVQIEPLLQDSVHYGDLSGQVSAWFDLRTQGTNQPGLLSHANGSFSAELQQGAYAGLDLNALLAGQAPQGGDATQIERFVLRGEVIDGVYHLQQTQLDSERFNARAFGRLHLPSAQIEARLQLNYHTPPAGLILLKDMQIPIEMRGPLRAPQWHVDMAQLMGADNMQRLLQFFQN